VSFSDACELAFNRTAASRAQTEAAGDLVRQDGHLDLVQLKQTATELALLNYIDTIMDHGQQLAEDSLKRNPAKFITLINACCNMSNANIAIENQKLSQKCRSRRYEALINLRSVNSDPLFETTHHHPPSGA
jgi:hypothetical protein